MGAVEGRGGGGGGSFFGVREDGTGGFGASKSKKERSKRSISVLEDDGVVGGDMVLKERRKNRWEISSKFAKTVASPVGPEKVGVLLFQFVGFSDNLTARSLYLA